MQKQDKKSAAPPGMHFSCALCASPLNSKQQNYFIDIPEVGGIIRLPAAGVISIAADGNYSQFRVYDGIHSSDIRTITCRRTLESWNYLAEAGLQRINRSIIVNLTKIYYKGNNGLIEYFGHTGEPVYIGDTFKDEVAASFKLWCPSKP